MAKVKVKAVKYQVGTGADSHEGYRFVTSGGKVLSESELCALLAERMGSSPEVAEAWLKGFMRTMIGSMMDGNSVNTGFMVGKLQVKGSTTSATGQPAKGSVEGVINFTGDVRDAFAALEVENDSKMVDASLLSLQQADCEEVNRITAANANMYGAGNMLYVDTTRPDEGVWLYKGAERLMQLVIVSSSTTSLVFKTPAELPEDGTYRLVIQTRNGEDPNEYTVATLSRYVIIDTSAE